ncbi:MAG: non-homologous end-joining DNA ligase [Saprospiraceae bacterium]|nr:non-homologous end-joining DNA ligase [Saprospiraceae bacterium]
MMRKKWFESLDSNDQEIIEKADFPEWVDPMLATLTKDYFSDPDWIFERKLDGVRCLVYKNGDMLKLGSRNRKDITEVYPEVRNNIEIAGDHHLSVDGEIVAFDGNVTSFSKLQNRMQLNSPDAKDIDKTPVELYVFDLIWLDGYDLQKLRLRDRKRLLKSIFTFNDTIHFTQHRNEDGEAFFKEACEKNWEGLIAKDATSRYLNSRSKKWLKFKCSAQQELVIGGYTDPEGDRIGFGAILVGFYEDDELRYAGKVGTGFDDDELRSLHDKFRSLHQSKNPFQDKIGEEDIHFIKPDLVAEISFTEWTDDHKLRHPSYLGLRHDKSPKDVVKEDTDH